MSKRAVIRFLGVAGLVLSGATVMGLIGGYRVNVTPSEPLGLWRVESSDARFSPAIWCLSARRTTPSSRKRLRGYLRSGLCPGWFAPLIKSVLALPGQRVEIADRIVIDGHPVSASTVSATDSEGRAIAPFAGGVVPPRISISPFFLCEFL